MLGRAQSKAGDIEVKVVHAAIKGSGGGSGRNVRATWVRFYVARVAARIVKALRRRL